MTARSFITLGEHRLAYQYEPAPNRLPMVLLHGMGGSSDSWTMLRRFFKSYYSLYALDLPGHGATPAGDKPISIRRNAQLVTAFIQHHGLERPILVGHSMGAQIAVAATLWEQLSLQGLLLLAPAGIEAFSHQEAQWMLQGMDWLHGKTPPWLRQWADASESAGLHSVKEAAGQDQLLMQCIRAMLQEPVHQELEAVRVPSLLIFGGDDRLIPNRMVHWRMTVSQLARQQAGRIPKAAIRVLKQAGHFMHRTHPKSIFRQIQLQPWAQDL